MKQRKDLHGLRLCSAELCMEHNRIAFAHQRYSLTGAGDLSNALAFAMSGGILSQVGSCNTRSETDLCLLL